MASRQDPHEQGSKVGHAGIAGASIPIAVGKRGGQRETSAMVTNNSPHVAANKSKKTRKRFKKKKGRVEGVVVPDSDATTIPHSERLLPNSVDSVDIPITSSALMEKDTKEKQQDIPEQHEQRSGDGKDGCKYCDIVNERVVTGGSTTPPAVSGQNSVASDTEGVETINKSLDSSFSRCKKRDVDGTSEQEINELQGFQEREPLLRPRKSSTGESAVRPGVHTHEKICDSSRTPTPPLHGEPDPNAYTPTCKSGEVEHYLKRKRSSGGVPVKGLDRTEVDPIGERFEAAEWKTFGDEGLDDDEENLLLTMFASDMDSSSPWAPTLDLATTLERSPCGRSNNTHAAESVPPCSPVAAGEKGIELKRWETEVHDWEGAGVTSRVDSPDLSSPPRPRRPGSNGENCKGRPPSPARPTIWNAVVEGNHARVEAKLAAGAWIDEADSEGRTPLMIACALGDAAMTSLLVKRLSPPASVATRTIEGWTPLMIACGGGKLEVVKELMDVDAGLHDRDRVFGSNPLMWACGGGHSEVVRFILRHGAQGLIHSVNSDMWTPLMIACDAESLKTARILVEAGADLNAFNKDGLTTLDVATKRKNPLLMCYLRTEGGVSCTKFWSAAKAGDDATVGRLLRGNGHMVGTLDKDGRTALLLACVGGHLGVTRILVEAGADVDFQDSSGISPLSAAVVLGHLPLTRYLVQTGGAKLSVRDSDGWTPLMQTVMKSDLVMSRYLVDRGAAVNDGTPEGESVLDIARRFANSRIQRYISSQGGFSAIDVKRQIRKVENGERGRFSW